MESSWSCLGSLEASWKRLGRLLEASGAEKMILRAAPGRSKRNLKTGFSYLGDQKAPKTEPGRVPNRTPEATQAENGETLIVDDNTQDFVVFSSPGAPI